ncbi:MAG: glycosyltransferase [Oligoflexia bacterium]|nr:glycosyltransferase [Oligoflexia bacterium]
MISIVTITYNNFIELQKTLTSLFSYQDQHLSQTIEIIVVNGGICPNSKKFLNDYQLKSKVNVTIIHEPDGGIADAFNKGVHKAKGKAISFLNSGDLLLDKEYYAWSDKFLDQHPEYEFIHGDVIFNDTLCGPLKMGPTHKNIGRGMPYYHQTMIVRTKVFEKIGGFDSAYRINMDYHFVCKMEKNGIDYSKGLYYKKYQDRPLILMDGRGISATKEWSSIRESYHALRVTQMLGLVNLYGLVTRFIFMSGRMVLIKFNLQKLLICLKKIKHPSL